MRMRFVVAVIALLASATPQAHAQDYVTTGFTFLRRTPSDSGAKIRTLAPRESLTARTVRARPGFLPVRTSDGKAGWVGEKTVRDLHAEAASSATTLAGSAAAAATRIDSTWAKPAIDTSTIDINSATGPIACGPHGKSSKPDDGTNLHKNRNDIPTTSHLVTVDAMRSLGDSTLWRIKGTPPFRTRWTAKDSALVTPYEGIPLTVEGFFEVVKPQSGGSGESPNCNAKDERDTDWHIALVADPSETEDRAVVVEPTPRTKRNNKGWTPEKAAALAVRHSAKDVRHEQDASRVRVTGFLMLDPVHANHIGKFRSTFWEIHPITRIEVLRNGQWLNLNDLELPE